MARYATMLAILVSLPAWLLTTRAEDRPPATQPNSAPPQIDSLIFTQIPVRSGSFPVDPDDAAGLVPGSRLVLFDPRSPAKGITSLTSEYVAAGRPDLSFDGRRILFVGRRRSTEPLGVWEMEINGRGSRPIVQLPTDCTEARYLSTLFTIDAKEPEHRICFCNVDAAGISSLYTCRMDGTKIRRITFNPAGASHPIPAPRRSSVV